MPQQQSRFAGLLDDPMFQLGLGILGNSQGTTLGTALGRGGLTATQNLNQRRQFEQQKQYQDLHAQDIQQRIKVAQNKQDAIDRAIQNNPELADAYRINPDLALKAQFPQIAKNAADPYYTTIATDKGLGRFNARDGTFELITNPDGSPYVKSTDDPTTRGNVSAAEAQGKALWKPNTDVDGVVSTDAQIAGMANPSLGNIDFLKGNRPALPTVAPSANFPRVTPKEQGARDGMRLQILLDEQKKLGGAGVDPQLDAEINSVSGGRIPARPSFGGISVPTKAQQAGAAELAKSSVNLAMDPQITSAVTNAKNQSNLAYEPQINAANKEATMKTEASTQAALDLPQSIAQGQETVGLVDDLLKHKGFKSAVGMSSYNPLNKLAGTNANDFNIRLEQLKGKQFLQAFQSLKGGGQITEVEGKKATDAIARMNPSASEEEFRKAADDFKSVIDAGMKRAKQKAGVSGSGNNDAPAVNAAPLPAKPSALTLKKGTVYATPKGKLRWNGKSFEDL